MEFDSFTVFVGVKGRVKCVHVDALLGIKCDCDEFVYRTQWLVCPHMLFVNDLCQGSGFGRIINQLLTDRGVKKDNKSQK